jgi:phage baseplate assembly protein W
MLQAGATGMQIPEETIYDGNIETPTLVAASQISVLGNDTIQTIAARTGTDWKQIASLNNLDYPFVSSNPMDAFSPAIASGIAPEIAEAASEFRIEGLTPAPGNILAFDSGNITLVVKSYDGWSITVTTSAPAGIPKGGTVTVHEKQMSIAVPGQKLSIPGSSPTIGQISGSSETFDEMLFGIDEMLDSNGEMPDYNTDIVVAAGTKNLAMQIYHRINTLKGELSQLGHPEYGSLVPTFIGKPMTPVWQERILLECRLAAEADPRVQYLDNVRLYNEGTALFFEADLFPNNNQDPVVVSIPLM